MHRTGFQVVFVVVLMFAATVKTEKGKAEFSRKTVTLTCPQDGEWHDNADKKVSELDRVYEFNYTRQVKYSCKNKESGFTYLFYIKGRACENCFELDGVLFMVVLTVDLTLTSLLMIIIYRCNKKNTSDAPTRTPKAPVRPGGMAPPVPSPDYESLNPHTRTADTYSTVVNRMG